MLDTDQGQNSNSSETTQSIVNTTAIDNPATESSNFYCSKKFIVSQKNENVLFWVIFPEKDLLQQYDVFFDAESNDHNFSGEDLKPKN